MFSANTSQVAAGAGAVNYIEDVFSTYLYQGTGSSQTINNGIDLSTKGGLVWFKSRSGAYNHALIDTARGGGQVLSSNTTSAQADYSPQGISAFNTNGFTFGTTTAELNNASNTYVSWTFREAPKFFDIVTWSGNGTTQTLSHNLGSAPGFIMVKAVSGATAGSQAWWCYHQALGASYAIRLNLTSASANMGPGMWGNNTTTVTPSSATFTIGADDGVNSPSNTYVAYLFAHNAGGFGLTGTDNVISCGSYTGNGSASGPVVTLGYEPQWLLVKNATSVRNWFLVDNMRGLTVGGVDPILQPNSSSAEQSGSSYDYFSPTATGFSITNSDGDVNASGSTYIYIAIRRGPMKVPTSGTSVFDISTVSTSSGPVPGPTPTDMTLNKPSYNAGLNDWRANDRLRGGGLSLYPNTTGAEAAENYVYFDYQSGLRLNSWPVATTIWYNFKRAPSFFDEVCYTGTGSATAVTHNLAAAPELMIVKSRSSGTYDWRAYSVTIGNTNYLTPNSTGSSGASSTTWNNTTPTASVFTVGTSVVVNGSGLTYVAYLFATCAGVSKVGSYTGTGATQTIDCGFTGGARFVMIKRTNDTGDWRVWDTARGMVAGTDPNLFLNTTDAEANVNAVYTTTGGFQIVATGTGINASGSTYLFLAIA